MLLDTIAVVSAVVIGLSMRIYNDPCLLVIIIIIIIIIILLLMLLLMLLLGTSNDVHGICSRDQRSLGQMLLFLLLLSLLLLL